MSFSLIMTERCQKKFVENFENSKFYFCGTLLAISAVVICCYRFPFSTIIVSYVLGCLVCYFTYKSKFVLVYIERFKEHFLPTEANESTGSTHVKGCITCGSKKCQRHNSEIKLEPWIGLHIHKQLDQAIEDFYNAILDQYVSSWYSKITSQPFFIDELRHQLRYASACLLRRAVKINYSRFITERLLPCALRHYTLCADLTEDVSLLDSKLSIHPAAANRNAELKYLRCVTNAIMPYLLRKDDMQNSVFQLLVREIFAGWVLLLVTDTLADPHIINTLVILATSGETMAELPATPNYSVEFLETFVRQNDALNMKRSKLFRIDLDMVLSNQEYFYAFMQFMKTTEHFHLLQFCKDIKSFQMRILNPELTAEEESSLFNEAWDLYATYFDPESLSSVKLDVSLIKEMKLLLEGGVSNIKKLQTSRALYQAERQSHAVLEKIMLPRFLHSEEFYKIFIGSRAPTGYHKQMTKKPQENLLSSALKLGNRLKGALKSHNIEDQLLNTLPSDMIHGTDAIENMDIFRYIDSLAEEEARREKDLSTCKVVLTNVETRLQVEPRRGTVRVFTLAVHRADSAGASFWSVERSENDFHLLRSKLLEFHGEKLLQDLPLPSRRDNSPMETIRYKYEDFLQRLLQKSILHTSELLWIFVSADGDFSMAVQAASLGTGNTDLANLYQSVTHKLRKEKGQHLENFMNALLISSDKERYQALKFGTNRDIEEAQEVNEEVYLERIMPLTTQMTKRDLNCSVFGDNFGVPAKIYRVKDNKPQEIIVGFTQCLMFLLLRVVKCRTVVSHVIGSVCGLTRTILDQLFVKFLNATLRNVLSDRRLAHLIHLGHGLLFEKRNSKHSQDPLVERDIARKRLAESIPPSLLFVLGGESMAAVLKAFDILQRVQLNKQLVYNLLDLCIAELFPELMIDENECVDEPKS